jgi:hypothetical protein
MNSYFYKFMINLLQTFSSERKLLEARGPFIIRSVLCATALTPPLYIVTKQSPAFFLSPFPGFPLEQWNQSLKVVGFLNG